jgi:ketosteroid isomerase-like protein
MSSDHERAAFQLAHDLWAASDLEGFLSLLTEDVLYTVNVDGLAVPFAASALGREDVRHRLHLLLDSFVIERFEPRFIVEEADHFRSLVDGRYVHRKTGEVLLTRIRFRVWFRDGLIALIDEHHDAAYVEAFQRFVFHIQNAALDE